MLRVAVFTSIAFVLIAATVPSLQRKARATRSSEAVDRLGEIYRRSLVYWAGEQVGPVAPARSTLHTLPPPASLTPATIPAGHAVTDSADTWSSPTWNALEFRFTEPHYYAYQYEASGDGTTAGFTARAHGDLDGNGIASTYERAGAANAQMEMRSSSGLWIDHAFE